MPSTPPPSGWYPDPGAPAQLRYWDGRGWTAHTAPAGTVEPAGRAGYPVYPTYPTQPPATPVVPGISRTAAVLIGVGVLVFVLLATVFAVLFAGIVGTPSGATGLAGLDPEDACATTAEEAVRVSEEQHPPVRLEDVEDLRVVEDRRESHEVPTGGGDETVLTCRGTGVWSDGDTTTPVLVRVTVDSEGQYFVFYEATDAPPA